MSALGLRFQVPPRPACRVAEEEGTVLPKQGLQVALQGQMLGKGLGMLDSGQGQGLSHMTPSSGPAVQWVLGLCL